jgi:UDP:flavonoid glycosyltransferase YjiC (YdhE family)
MGTDGDVFPFVGLGARLRFRGHRVTLVANQHYQTFASHHGLAFRALVSDEETNELMGNPDVWHPIKSAMVGARWAGPAIERQNALLAELATGEESVLVSNPPVFAARIVHEMLLCPLVSLVVMPWMIQSVISPPTLAGPINLPRWAPRLAVKLHWRLLSSG